MLIAACSSEDGGGTAGGTGAATSTGGSSAAGGSGGATAGGSGGVAGGSNGGGGASGSGAVGGAGASGAGGFGGGGAGGGGGTGGGAPTPLYLVSIDHFSTPSTLLKVDVKTGVGKVACSLPLSVDAINYPSSTFSRNGILFASNYQDGTLEKIDPCTCAVTPVGKTGYTTIPGITANKTDGLFGIETSTDVLLDISPVTGKGTKVGDLGVDFVNGGATWSDALNGGLGGLYGINSATNQLYTVSPTTGLATSVVTITGVTFGSVGVELHPANGVIYACTDDTLLYSIDPTTGKATAIGTGMGHTAPCNNLAAPWIKVACLDAL